MKALSLLFLDSFFLTFTYDLVRIVADKHAKPKLQ